MTVTWFDTGREPWIASDDEPLCDGSGEIAVPVGPRDRFGNQHAEYDPCPGCPRCLPKEGPAADTAAPGPDDHPQGG